MESENGAGQAENTDIAETESPGQLAENRVAFVVPVNPMPPNTASVAPTGNRLNSANVSNRTGEDGGEGVVEIEGVRIGPRDLPDFPSVVVLGSPSSSEGFYEFLTRMVVSGEIL